MDKRFILVFLLLCSLSAKAQEFVINDSLRLHEVVINGTRLKDFLSGHRVELLDSSQLETYKSENITEVLKKNGLLYVHYNSPAGLATTSFRGLNAAHTAIIWNGFNLQNIMNGELDMNLLPVYLLDDIKLQYGGSGALFGSGAVGGAIHLTRKNQIESEVSLSSHLGVSSFGGLQLGKTITVGNGTISSTTKILYRKAENNYNFENFAKYKNPIERMPHAAYEQKYLVQHNQFKLSRKDQLDFSLWLQNSHRQIPASITSKPSKAVQDDNVFRASFEYNRDMQGSSLFIRSGYFVDQIIYIDPDTWIDADNKSYSSVSEVEFRQKISSSLAFNSGIQLDYHAAKTDNYPDNLNKNRLSAFGSVKYAAPYEHFNATLSVRNSLVDGNFIPIVPSLAVEYGINDKSVLRANIGRNYRLPTFNDLYWIPLGNPNLVPESGWSQEVTFEHSLSQHTNFSVTVYNSAISDLIKWQPDTNGLFKPNNISKVWSKGLESSFSTAKTIGSTHLEFLGRYSFSMATQKLDNDASTNESRFVQLMYKPKHLAFGSLKVERKGLFFSYQHQFTGKRYTSTDNDSKSALPMYQTGDLHLGGSFNWHKYRFHFTSKVNNVWNEQYECVAFYPMPGRSYHLSMNIEFKF